MSDKRMTPKEVATFWFKKSAELEAKLKDSEEYWFKHSSDLEDKLAQSEAARRDLANELGDLKNKWSATELAYQNQINKIYDGIHDDAAKMRTWYREQLAKVNEAKSSQNSMTYEQIVDLKCENKRLIEQLAKFAKWQQLLDKFKIF